MGHCLCQFFASLGSGLHLTPQDQGILGKIGQETIPKLVFIGEFPQFFPIQQPEKILVSLKKAERACGPSAFWSGQPWNGLILLQPAYEYARLYCFWLCAFVGHSIHESALLTVSTQYLENAWIFYVIGAGERKVPFDNRHRQKFKMASTAAKSISVLTRYLTNACSNWPKFFGVN